jgi:hypothetical protein
MCSVEKERRRRKTHTHNPEIIKKITFEKKL